MSTCQISRCLGYAFDVSDAAATAAAAAAAATAVTAAAPAVATTVAVATAIAVSAATATFLPFLSSPLQSSRQSRAMQRNEANGLPVAVRKCYQWLLGAGIRHTYDTICDMA